MLVTWVNFIHAPAEFVSIGCALPVGRSTLTQSIWDDAKTGYKKTPEVKTRVFLEDEEDEDEYLRGVVPGNRREG